MSWDKISGKYIRDVDLYFRLKYTQIPNLKNLSSTLAHLWLGNFSIGLEFGYNTIFSARIQLRFVIFKVRLEKSQLVGITNTYCDIIFLPRFVNHFLIGLLIYLSDCNIEGFHLIQVSPTIWDHPFKTSAFFRGRGQKLARFADG